MALLVLFVYSFYVFIHLAFMMIFILSWKNSFAARFYFIYLFLASLSFICEFFNEIYLLILIPRTIILISCPWVQITILWRARKKNEFVVAENWNRDSSSVSLSWTHQSHITIPYRLDLNHSFCTFSSLSHWWCAKRGDITNELDVI